MLQLTLEARSKAESALQAGREIRIFVKPEEIGDLEAKNLARDIALKIEKDLKYVNICT